MSAYVVTIVVCTGIMHGSWIIISINKREA